MPFTDSQRPRHRAWPVVQAPPPPFATLEDNFNGAGNLLLRAADSGQYWVNGSFDSPNYAVASGKMYMDRVDTLALPTVMLGIPIGCDHSAEVIVGSVANGGKGHFGVDGMWSANVQRWSQFLPTEYYVDLIAENGSGYFDFHTTINYGDAITVKVTCAGSTLTLYVNGSAVGSCPLGTVAASAGHFYLRQSGTSSTNNSWKFDYVKVMPL